MKKPTNEIIRYVNECILPVYSERIAYKRAHIDYVIRRSLLFANQVSNENGGRHVNTDMVYVIAAYHDIGEVDNRKTHELVGANMLREDKRLKARFDAEQIETMAQAVEDHRASGKKEPRSIYGRIVSSADRITSVDDLCVLMHGFRARYGCSQAEIIENAYEHLCEKFGESGYALSKMYFKDPEFDRFKEETVALSKDKEKFIKRFLAANDVKE